MLIREISKIQYKMERYSRGRRGAPAKGVVQKCSTSSNLVLSARISPVE